MKEIPIINIVIDALIKAGYQEEEAIELVGKLLEQEAENYTEVMKMLKNKSN